MSAYIVDTFHIDTLVNAAISYNQRGRARITFGDVLVESNTATDTGAQLLATNIASVLARYPYDTLESAPGPCNKTAPIDYRYKWSSHYPMQAVTILKALDCYEYQSCEVENYESSPAAAFCQQLRKAAIHALPGYDDAPWELIAPDLDAIRARIAKQVS